MVPMSAASRATRRAPPRRLGNTTKSAARAAGDAESLPSSTHSARNTTAAGQGGDAATAGRIARYELQETAARALGEGARVGVCLKCLRPGEAGVKVLYSPARGSAHYGGLMVCGSVWVCPVCAAKISERRRVELTAAVEAWRARGGVVLIAAYTFAHGPRDALSGALGRFLAAQRALTSHKGYKRLLSRHGVLGTVKALEVTWGEANGWHPHTHTLMFLDGAGGVDVDAFQAELYGLWAGCAARQGLMMDSVHGVKVQSTWGAVYDYVQKWGHAPTRRVWDAADELTKAHSKRDRLGERYTPFDLLRSVADVGDAEHLQLFREYAVAFKGRRQLVWSAGLRAAVGLVDEQTDAEIAAEEVDEAVTLAVLGREEWAAVVACRGRAQLLEVARSGDAGLVAGLVESMRERAFPGGGGESRPPP